MSTSARRHAAVTWAALFAVAAMVDLARVHDRPDDASFRAGYTAVSDAVHGEMPMTLPGVSSESVCDTLYGRSAASSVQLIARDFVSGCRRAIAEAAE